MSRIPTEGQYGRLRVLGSGGIAITPARRDWAALVRHGWVQPLFEDDGIGSRLPPLQITPAGYLALATGARRYGLPQLQDPPADVSEPAYIAKLRRDLDEARAERDSARHRERLAVARLAAIKRIVGPIEVAS